MTGPRPTRPSRAGSPPGPGREGPVGRAVAFVVDAARRRAPWVVLGAVAATLLLLLGPVRRLGIDTDTEEMISDRLEWRQRFIRYQEIFPQYANELVVVIEGETPHLTDRARGRLVEALRAEPHLFPSIHAPGADPFFRRHALLYLSPVELDSLKRSIERYGAWLRRLERRPRLESLTTVLREALSDARRDTAGIDPAPILGAIAEAFRAATEWRFHQISWQELLSGRPARPDERRAYVLVQPRVDFGSLLPASAPLSRLRALVEELGLEPARGVRVRLTGDVAMAHEELESVMRGASRAGALALLTVSVILYLGLRSIRLLIASVATLVVGLVATAAFASVAIGHLNLISVAFAVLFIGLGIDYAIHFCLRYRARGETEDHAAALAGAGRDVGPAIALSAVTTAVCFYAFVPTDFVGISELGVISGTGMFFGLAVTVTVLPALLSLLPAGRPLATAAERPEDRRTGPGRTDRGDPGRTEPGPLDHAWISLRRLGDLAAGAPRRHPRRVVGVAVALALGCLALLPGLRFDHNPLNLRDRATESVATYLDLVADSTSHPLTLALVEPDAAAARAAADRVSRLDVVRGAVTLDDFVPRGQAEKRWRIDAIARALGPRPERADSSAREAGREPASGGGASPASGAASVDGEPTGLTAVRELLPSLAAFRPFASPEAAGAARLLGLHIREWLARVEPLPTADRVTAVDALERTLLGSLPGRIDALRAALDPGVVERDDLPQDLVARWVSPTGLHRVEVLPRENVSRTPALRRFVEGVRARAPEVTGAPLVELEAGDAVVGAFREAFLLAILATAGILLVVLRRIRETAYILAPLALAGLITLAACVLLGLPLNFANIIVLPLLLGVGVDAGIHMVHRGLRAPPSHGDPLRTSTARAILFSSITTVASFGNLALSGHPGTASMGVLLTLGMTAVLVSTLAVLPALLPGARGTVDSSAAAG